MPSTASSCATSPCPSSSGCTAPFAHPAGLETSLKKTADVGCQLQAARGSSPSHPGTMLLPPRLASRSTLVQKMGLAQEHILKRSYSTSRDLNKTFEGLYLQHRIASPHSTGEAVCMHMLPVSQHYQPSLHLDCMYLIKK